MAQPARIAEMLQPGSVAVIGASDDLSKFGGRLFHLLVRHRFDGAIYPINRRRESLSGMRCYPQISATPRPPDMAVVAVPRDHVEAAVRECAQAGTRLAIVITAKFSDAGPEGARLEAEIVATARRHGMRLLGPNCLGLISPANQLVLCASPALYVDRLPRGRIGMVSQSGALMTTLFDRAQTRGVGFSHCFSIGNQADLELCDFLDFFTEDTATDVICAYIEGIKDGRRFVEAAQRAHAAGKPLLAVKAGRSDGGTAAAFSHTASLAGSYAACAAACRDAGVVLMDNPDAMIMLACALTRFERPARIETGLLTTSGGAGAISADLLAEHALPLSRYAAQTLARLGAHYAPEHAAANPLDLGTSMQGGSTLVEDSIAALLADPETGIVLCPLTTAPDMLALSKSVLNGLAQAEAGGRRKPCLVVLQPGQVADAARRTLREHGLFYFDDLHEAVRVIDGYRALARTRRRRARRESAPGAAPAGLRGALDEAQAKRVLAAFGVPVNRGEVAADAAAGQSAAECMSAPFAVKLVSPDIVHKSDAGAVALGLATPPAVARAIDDIQTRLGKRQPSARIEGFLVQEMATGQLEMFIGARRDPIFGALITVGAGGTLVELLQDTAVRRAPVSRDEAREMLSGLRVAPLLHGFRGGAALDLEALAESVSRISWLAHEFAERFIELDVNPVLVRETGQGVTAVDARILLKED